MRSVQIRNVPHSCEDFEIMATDPAVGVFALHAGFEIDLGEPGSAWRRVSLDEFKSIIRQHWFAGEDLPNASDSSRSYVIAQGLPAHMAEGEPSSHSIAGLPEACVRHVCRILYRAGIAHLVTGTTFIVPCVLTARLVLQWAGLRRSEISQSAFIEPTTGCAIQLVERNPALRAG